MLNTGRIARIIKIGHGIQMLEDERARLTSEIRGGESHIIVVAGDQGSRVTNEMIDTLNALGHRDSQRSPHVLFLHLHTHFFNIIQDVAQVGVMATRLLTETNRCDVQHRGHEKVLRNRHRNQVNLLVKNKPHLPHFRTLR